MAKRRPSADVPRRQSTHKPAPTPTMQVRERMRVHLIDAVNACEDLFGEHGQECACEVCALVSNFVGSLRLYVMLINIT